MHKIVAMRNTLILFLFIGLALSKSTDWCPAHRTTTVSLEDGSTMSWIEPCPETPLIKEAPKNSLNLMNIRDNHDPFEVLPKYIANVKVGQTISWSGRWSGPSNFFS